MNMTKCKLFYVLSIASIASFFMINFTNAIVINQSTHNESRNLSDSELSEKNSMVGESGLKKITQKKSNDYIFHPLKFSPNEKKFEKNLFSGKSVKNNKRIERHLHGNNDKKRGCKKICYPLCYIQNINCKEDMNSHQSNHPQNPFYQFPIYGHPYYLNNIFNYPYEFPDSSEEEEEEDDDFSDYQENLCTENENSKSAEDDDDSKKIFQPSEGETTESKGSTGKASGGTEKFPPQIDEAKKSHLLKLFSKLTFNEQNILQQAVSKILREYNSTLRENYQITNLKEIFENSQIERMLINSIRIVLKRDNEEHSIKWITDEIIQSALMDFVIKNNLSENNSQKTLIPIAEGSFKIGQWIHGKKEENEETQNLFNIETQITPSIDNKLGNEVSMTVNSRANPLKTKFSIEIENGKKFPSESEVIDNLPTQYYSQESKSLNYRKNNHQDIASNSQFTEFNQYPEYRNVVLNSERETNENDQFSQVSSDKSGLKFEKYFHVSNGNGNNSQVSGSLKQEQNSESNNNSNMLKNQSFKEKTNYRELMRNKKHTDSETNCNETINTSKRNVYNKNPRIIQLLMNDQKKIPIVKNYSLSSHAKIDKNSQLDSINSKINENVNYDNNNNNKKFVRWNGGTVNIVNDNFQKTTGIEKIGQIDSGVINKNIADFNVNGEKIIENNDPIKELKNTTSLTIKGNNTLKKSSSKYRNSFILGKLVPKNKENSEYMYKGNLLKLPVKLTKLNDGSFLVTLLNKIRNCSHKNHSSHHSRNQSGINKRDNEGKFLEKNESFTANSNDKEIIKTEEYLKDAIMNFTTSGKENKTSAHEQYKQYLETLLDVNDIPKNERSVVITDILEKKFLNDNEFNFEVNKKNASKKDGLRNNNFIVEKITFKPGKQNRNIIEYKESSTNNINAAVDIIKVLLNWLHDFILTTLNVKKS